MANTNEFLEKENLGRLMAQYAIPCVISLLVAALYNIVDQIFIANADYLGSTGNAANTVVFPLTVIALAIATMIGDGCCAFVSMSLGAKEPQRAQIGIASSILSIIVASIVLMALYLVCMNPILTLFGARVNEETVRMSQEYFFWITLGIPFYMFGQALNPIIRSDGSPRFAMLTLLAGALINIVCDPIFIFVLHWGMMGAAIATVLGQIAAAALALWYVFHMKTVTLTKTQFAYNIRIQKKIIALGAASFLAQISVVISMAAVLNMAKLYGARDAIFCQEQYAHIPTAVVGIVMKFFQIIISISIGLAAGCIPIVAYNTGAQRLDRVRALLKKLLFTEAAVGFIATCIFLLFPQFFAYIFGAASESDYYAHFFIRAVRITLCMTTLSCVNKGTTIFLQSLGKAKASTALSFLREIIFGAGFPILLPIFIGLDGILFFMPAADILTACASSIVIAQVYKELQTHA